MRVLHGPVNIGNQPWMLSRFERKVGLESDLVVTEGTWLKYASDRTLDREGESRWRSRLRRARFAALAPMRYQVMHYYFGRSYMSGDPAARHAFADIRWARALGRPVFFTLQGCDVRMAGRSRDANAVTMCNEGACPEYGECVASTDARRQRFVDRVLPLADQAFYLNPELGNFVPGGSFLPYVNVDMDAVRPGEERGGHARPLILHAPTDPGIKGTAHVLRAVEALRPHYDFEFRMVEGLPHHEAMALYRDADLVVDQVLAGWYGGFAVELMAMGKPVACYLREEDLHFLPPRMREELPLLRVDPQSLVERLGLPRPARPVARVGCARARLRRALAPSRAHRARPGRRLPRAGPALRRRRHPGAAGMRGR